jgi:hypothetical protein
MTKRILNEEEYWNISYIKTGDIENKISRWSLNNWDCEKGLNLGQLNEIWKYLRFGIFGIRVQRRGAHVNIPKIGSRDGEICFGGILGFYAELRREYYWGNLKCRFFWVLFGFPRRSIEVGGTNGVFGGMFLLLVRGFVRFNCCL